MTNRMHNMPPPMILGLLVLIVTLEFIKSGKPMQNGFIERFNRTYRTEVLDMFVFKGMQEVREITENWVQQYNEERPYESLGNLTPMEYLAANQ